jgi:hypothetical protein
MIPTMGNGGSSYPESIKYGAVKYSSTEYSTWISDWPVTLFVLYDSRTFNQLSNIPERL